MKKPIFAPFLLIPLILSACQPATPAAVPSALPSAPAGETAPPPISGTPSASSEAVVKMSIDMLHEKFNIPTDAVTVTEVTPMTWPDASLGCPKRGVLYIQTVTPGFQILLEAEGHVFTFHTDEKSLAVLCSVNPPDEIYLQP